MENKSGIGDWLFLGVMVVFLAGYFGYENQAQIMQWMATMQAPAEHVSTAGGGVGGFFTQYWGATALVLVLVILGIRSRLSIVAGGVDEQAIDYSSPAWIDVKTIE